MKKSFRILIMLMGLSLMLAACGKKKDSNEATVTAAREARAGANSSGTLPSGQAYTPGTEVAVYAQDSYYNQFNQAIKVLVSATMDPSNVGNVDNRNGVKLRGSVTINTSTGRIDTANSKIELSIQDDLKNSDGELYQPIVITVLGTSGTAMNGQVNLTFSDQYGSINLTGTYDANTFRGNVNFQNAKSYNGLSGGTLGSFEVPVCGFFKCN